MNPSEMEGLAVTDLERAKTERAAITNAIPVLELQIESLRQRAMALDLEIARAEAPAPTYYPAPSGGRMVAKVRSACRYCGTKTSRTTIGSGLEIAECAKCAASKTTPWAAMVDEAIEAS